MASSGKSGIATLLGFRGDKPKVPEFTPINTTEEAAGAIAGNLENLAEAAKLASRTDAVTANNFLQMMERLLPGFGQINKTIGGNIQSMVSGQLPADVERYIGQRAAERGVVRGTGGSQFDQYGALRDLGLTSLELTDRGLNSAQRWLSSVSSAAPSFNVTSMFISPAQRIATQQWNKSMQYNRDWLNNQIKALPSNEEMAYAQMLDYVADFATMAAGVGMGSVGGGAGAGMGGAAGAGGGQYYQAAANAAMQRQPTIPADY